MGEKEKDTIIYAERMYLEYWNNFLTVTRFAEYYGMNPSIANRLIDLGRTIYMQKTED